MIAALKTKLVVAHRAQDWELAAKLSARMAEMKASAQKFCRRCGSAVTYSKSRASVTGFCRTCLNYRRYHANKIATPANPPITDHRSLMTASRPTTDHRSLITDHRSLITSPSPAPRSPIPAPRHV